MMTDDDGNIRLINNDFVTNTWYQTNFVCKNYASSGSNFQDCFLSFRLGGLTKYFPVKLSPYELNTGSFSTIKFGDESASFCGFLRKVTLFTNVSAFEDSSTCSSLHPWCSQQLGSINPVCITPSDSYPPTCGSNEYPSAITHDCLSKTIELA
mgnify:CR=1 FL=1